MFLRWIDRFAQLIELLWIIKVKRKLLEVEVKMLKNILSKIKYFLSKESCYTEMERRGIASMGCCCGVVGGTSSTNYLSESCCDCKYFTLIGDE